MVWIARNMSCAMQYKIRVQALDVGYSEFERLVGFLLSRNHLHSAYTSVFFGIARRRCSQIFPIEVLIFYCTPTYQLFFYRNAVILILQVTWKAPTGKVGPYSKWRPRSWGHWVPRLRMPTKADLARPEEDFRDQEQSLPSIILAWKMADATNPANTIGNFLEACVSFIEIVVICYLRGGREGEICIVCTPIQDSITSATFFHSSWARFFRTKILFICKCESKRGALETKGLEIEPRAAGWAYVYDQSGWK